MKHLTILILLTGLLAVCLAQSDPFIKGSLALLNLNFYENLILIILFTTGFHDSGNQPPFETTESSDHETTDSETTEPDNATTEPPKIHY